MPKFLVTSGSYFEPYTYDQLSKPVIQTVEAHNASQDVYDQLSMETSALGRYITDNPGDAEAKRMYDSYLSRLNSLQDNLWNNGYNASTRRDLAAARAGYANNISRLQAAITARQERSKEFWDTRHKNPELVTSADPGLSGLDNYLNDDNYGRNWFSYDSAQFEKDVFAEMQARAQGMMSDITDENGVVRNPALADTLTRVITRGVTSGEVNAATSLVDGLIDMTPEQRNAFYQNNGVSPVVSMMTESLINRYNATGIRDYEVSAAERAKLINRGKAGLVGGVMKPETKDFNDPEFEFDMWKRKEDYSHKLRMEELAAKDDGKKDGKSGKSGKEADSYSLQTLSSYLDSPESQEITAFTNKQFKEKFKDPIPITNIDGTPDVITSAYDVERILDELGRKEFKQKWGVDPTENVTGRHQMPTGGGGRSASGDVRTIRARTVGSMRGDSYPGIDGRYLVSYDGKISKNDSNEFNEDIKAFRKKYDEWKEKNKNVDLYDLKIKNKNWDKMQEDYNLEGIPREYWPAILEAKADIGYRTPSYLASYTSDMPEVRENYASTMYSAYANAPKEKGEVAKTSHVAVKKITPDGKVIGLERNMKNVLGTKGKGSNEEIRTDTIQEISAYPEDVINNQVRFTTSLYDGTYAANPVIFGNQVAAVYRKFKEPVVAAYSDGSTVMVDDKGIVDYMMKPITDPASAFQMSDEQKKQWTSITANTLDGYMRFYSTDANGNVNGAVSPVTIVLSPSYREALRNAVTQYINAGLAGPRDAMNNDILQKKTASTGNPGTMDLGLTNTTE